MGVIGAILGDIAGQPYEFAACSSDLYDDTRQSGEYDLFNNSKRGNNQTYTDDTVMTIACLDCLLDNSGKWLEYKDLSEHEDEIVLKFSEYYRKWGKKYPFAGYGGMFSTWIHCEDMEPYNSYGNGSAMRVSPCFLYDIELARISALPTHNHKEGVKGAVVTVNCIKMAKDGKSKEDIYKYALSEYPSIHYVLNKDTENDKTFIQKIKSIFVKKPVKTIELDEYGLEKPETDGRYTYGVDRAVSEYHDTIRFSATCQESVPVAIRCFYETDSFESCMKLINSMLIDTDTIGAIAGGICEAYYGNCMGSHKKDIEIIERFLPEDMIEVLVRGNLLY